MDLQTLSRTTKADPDQNRPSTTTVAANIPAPRRRWISRIALPVLVLLAFLLLIGYAARDWVLPATRVQVVRASPLPSSPVNTGPSSSPGQPAAPAAVVAQAPGWVEADPYPIYVSALADGVVKEVLVLEGDTVKAGQPVVRLVEDDAKLAVEKAKAELARQDAVLAAAETDYNEPVALNRAVLVAEAGVAGAEAALTKLDAEVAKEEARLAELTAAYDRLAALTERSVSALQVDAAKYQMRSQEAEVEKTRKRRPELEATLSAANATHAAAKRDFELKVMLRQRLDEAKAAQQAAETKLAEAQLRYERMTIKSPADGVVMARLVSPGTKLMLAMDSPHSAHAIHLYDPEQLQVRVDVPLSDAAAVGLGQRAKIVVDVLPDMTFEGVVTRIVHQADIAKNTVQFKVAIEAPSALLKPDMLARVKFLGAGATTGTDNAGSPAVTSSTTRVALQRSAIIPGQTPAVWWVSPIDRRIQRRSVALGVDLGDGRIVIREGLNPGDLVVDQPIDSLQESQRVRYHDTHNNTH